MNLPTIVADAVVQDLNGHAFSESFTATRSFRPAHKLKELETLRVSVVPRAKTGERLNRAQWSHDLEIDVGVQKRLGDQTELEATMQALLDLVEEISDFFEANPRLKAYPKAVMTEIANDPIYVPEHIDQDRLFTSVLTLTLKVAQ